MKTGRMKAVECTKYGPPEVLKLVETNIPTPKADEIQIAIKASAVTASDIFIRSSDLPIQYLIPMRLLLGITKPRRSILGFVFAGVVESVGPMTNRFSTGDRVFGMTGFKFGAYAEYMCIKEIDSKKGCVSPLPENISFTEATAAAYGGSLALQYMDMGEIKQNQKVLIYGASGTSGTLAVQYGKYLGAHVTGVCSTKNLEFVRSIGADAVIDYTTTDHLEPGIEFDFILDSVGKIKSSKIKETFKQSLKKNGKYVSIDNGNLILSSSRLDQISELVISGRLKPFIDKTYPLDQIVEAHEYVQKGHKRGGVAIAINI
jgi:NADPH:quinone reductase-like Zn-dependent oxidoreductase